MKQLKKFGLVTVGIFVLLLLGAYSTYDYGLDCVKCLAGKHVVVHRFLGIPFYKGTTDGTRVVDYERIIGRPCRKGGFGKGSYSIFGFRVACGSTREGATFRFRLGALSSTYQLCRTLGEKTLARETMSLIEQLLPADASLQSHIPDSSRSTLLQLDDYLRQVSTVEQWRSVLESAKGDFRETPKLASITNGI